MKFIPDSASNFSRPVDHLSFELLIVSGFLVFAVIFLMILFCIRYRSGSTANRARPPSKMNWLELVVAGSIFTFGLGVFITSAKLFYEMYTPPADASTVYVTAKQWMWKFSRDDGSHGINELTLAVGKPVRLVMISEDVIHSFYVPAFRVKQDVLPGRYTTLWFTPTLVGDFAVFCTQYCGLSHSAMRATIHVVDAGKVANAK